MIFVVGPTASGKSALAMEIARKLDGEIICADSQTVRRGLDVGTAKPSSSDQEEVPHHMLDIIGPYEPFSVNSFKLLANEAIGNILSRGKVPIVVGGTGLYIDALYYDYEIDEKPTNQEYKQILEQKTTNELQEVVRNEGYPMPENTENPRHLIGVILRSGEVHKNSKPIKDAVIIGVLPEDEVLKKRISDRIDNMFENDFESEVQSLLKIHGRPHTKMDAIGYPIMFDYIDGKIDLDEAKELFKRSHWQYARRQKAWFKRNKNIKWLHNDQDIKEFLNKLNKY